MALTDLFTFELGRCKAWHQKNILRAISENLGELGHDLGQAVAVPQGCQAVHRRSNEIEDFCLLNGSGTDCLMNLTENWVDTKRDWGSGFFSAGQEVGEAGQQHDVGVFPHGPEGLGKKRDAAAWKLLTTRHQRTIATVRRVQMTLDVRIAKNRKLPRGQHGGSFRNDERKAEMDPTPATWTFLKCIIQ